MILAISEAATVAIVTVVVSAVLGPIAVAFASARAKRIEAAIGEPNGHGTVAAMLGKLLDGQTGQDQRLARIDDRLARGDERMARQDAEHRDLVARVARIETACTAIAEHTDTAT